MENLESKIQELVNSRLGEEQLSQIIAYAMFPAGKLFRPKLVLALAKDLNALTEDHYLLAAAIEAHHAYSLVHDDLPCMDDDDFRRGKLSAHKKYGEWKALLAGDAMINLSYELLADISSPKAKDIIAQFSRMMGAQGLILGQFIDLSHQKKTFSQTLFMHELKTARLIQFSLLASLSLSESSIAREEIENLGKFLGINFQLLDDLGELTEEVDDHEDQVNAFLNYDANEVLAKALKYNESIFATFEKHKLSELGSMYSSFLEKTLRKIEQGKLSVSKKTGLDPQAFEALFRRPL